jgi:uncharacterized protein YecE (DUF72 family)
VELRHRSWSDEFGPTLKMLNEHDAAFVRSTSPSSRHPSARTSCRTSRGFYYLRAHGRNFQKWWHHEHKDERYDHLYTAPEIKEFGETLKAVKKIVRKAYGYMNNHADAKFCRQRRRVEALSRRAGSGGSESGDAEAYPELKAIVPVKAKQDLLTPVRKG